MTDLAPSKPRSRRTLEVMVSAAGFHISSTVMMLVATPFFLRAVGLEVYGFWALLTSMVKYCGLANFGTGPAIVKYTAEYHTRGELDKIRQMVTFSTLFYLAMAIVIVPGVMFAAPLLVRALHLSPDLQAIAPGMFIFYAIYSVFWIATGGIASLLIGIGRFNQAAAAGSVGQVMFIATAGVLLAMHHHIMALAVANVVHLTVSTVIGYVLARRAIGPIFINPLKIEAKIVKPLFRVGGWIQLSSAMLLILFEVQQLLVGVFVGVAAVALYDVGGKLARAVRALAYYFNTVALPHVSSLEAESGRERAEATFVRSARYVGLISFATMGLLVASAPLVVALWLGTRYGNAPLTVLLVVSVLGLTYVVDNVTNVGVTVRRGLGTTRLEAVYTVTGAITTLVLSLALAPKFGVGGILAGTALGTAVGSWVFFAVFARAHQVRLWEALILPMLRILLATACAIGAFALTQKLAPGAVTASRSGMLLTLFVCGVSYSVAFLLGLRLARFFEPQDFAFVQRLAPGRLGRISRLPLVRLLFVAG